MPTSSLFPPGEFTLRMSCLRRVFRCLVLWLALFCSVEPGRADGPPLRIEQANNGLLQFLIEGSPDRSHRVEGSRDLLDWSPFFARRDTSSWSLTDEADDGALFYRMVESIPSLITPHGTWRTSIELPDDPFLSEPIGGTSNSPDPFTPGADVRFVKFAILLDHLPRVHFQDSRTYAFHYNFAAERLDPFAGMTVEEFNAVSLTREGQRIVLGAVMFAPESNEYGIQFVGQDAYPRETIRLLYQAVENAITAPAEVQGFYMPTFEQTTTAETERGWLAQNGIEVSSANRWYDGDACYANGWSLGRLRFVPADQIHEAYLAGTLLPTDILLTDGVPAEVPFLAGIISTAPATPNSHVAILAQSYNIPFVYLSSEEDQTRVHGLANSNAEVVLRARDSFGDCEIRVIDVTSAPAVFKGELLDLKQPPELDLSPIVSSDSITVFDLAGVAPEDISMVGGKAANFGFLRRVIPARSPDAMAFTFDLWTAYLDQLLPGTKTTLRSEIASRLEPFSWPVDIAALDAALREIRDLIKDTADFTPAQRTAIIASLSRFDDDRKLRFRSSTNVEDSANFIGAGLYDSFSGCIADDTDGDNVGPSHCDPTRANERGVFRAMRKVYASFYNLNAYIERLRHHVDESTVGMAILVHHSFPDEIEAANGVATSRLSGSSSFRFCKSTMVSQVGAISITNPTGGSLPEIVDVDAYRTSSFQGADLNHRQRSSLLRLGEETVMGWESNYEALSDDFFELCLAWQEHFGGINGFTLEFEYKKLTDGSLVIKQIRAVPDVSGLASNRLALLNEPQPMRVFQGEASTVMANHRLKSYWRFQTSSRWVDPKIESSFLIESDVDRIHDGMVISESGPPSQWPGHSFDVVSQFGNLYFDDSWTGMDPDAGMVDWKLRIPLPHASQYANFPTQILGDFSMFYEARYSNPLPDINYEGNPTTVTLESVHLEPGSPDDPPPPGSSLQERCYQDASVSLDVGFYWPPAPTGIVAGYTAPWAGWEETTITGLTTNPIVLRGYYSQTYRPGHHNFYEEFVFEPRLEDGIDSTTLAELQAANIRMIHFWTSGPNQGRVKVIGFDGVIRDL